MKNIFLTISIVFTMSSCQLSNQSSTLNPASEIDKIDEYNAQFDAAFTTSQMYCFYLNCSKFYTDKIDNNGRYEYFDFIESEEKYQKLFPCSTLKTALPKIDFSEEMLVFGFNNKTRNATGIKQFVVFDENQNLIINVVTKGQSGGGMGKGFISKIKKREKNTVIVNFTYNYTN